MGRHQRHAASVLGRRPRAVRVGHFQNVRDDDRALRRAPARMRTFAPPVSKFRTCYRTRSRFVIASSVNFLSPLFLGVVLDRFGPRVCSVVSLLFVTTGFVTFGLATSDFWFTIGKLW